MAMSCSLAAESSPTRRRRRWAVSVTLAAALVGCGPIGSGLYFALRETDDDRAPVAASLTQPASDNFDVALRFTLLDHDGPTASVVSLRWRALNREPGSTDEAGEVTPALDIAGSPLVPAGYPASVATGTEATLVWDSLSDLGFGNNQLVEIELTVSDGETTTSLTSEPFLVSNGPLGEAQQHATVGRPDGVTVGDLTGDGRPDLLACSTGDLDEPGSLTLLQNLGQSFSTSQTSGSPPLPGLPADPLPADAAANHFQSALTHPSECTLLDLDADGDLDLVAANAPHGTWAFDDLLTDLSQVLGLAGADAAQGFQNVTAHQALLLAVQDPATPGLELSGPWVSSQASVAALATATNPGPPLVGGDPSLDRVGWFVMDVVAADLDPPGAGAASGRDDLVVLHGLAQLGPALSLGAGQPFPPGAVVIRQADASGQLGRAYYLDPSVMGSLPVHCVVADLTGEGLPDLVVANQGDSSLTFYLQQASAQAPGSDAPRYLGLKVTVDSLLGGQGLVPAGDTRGLAVGDLNGDGLADLVVVGQGSRTAIVLLQDPDPTAPASLLPATGGALPLRMGQVLTLDSLQAARPSITDVTNDGQPDLILGLPLINEVQVFAGGGPALPTVPARFTTSFQPFEIKAQDLNGDGRTDLAVGCIFSRDVSVLYQSTPGTLSRLPDPVFTGLSPLLMASGDLDGDGVDEVVCSMAGDNELHVFAADPQRGLRLGRVYDLGAPASEFVAADPALVPFAASVPVLAEVADVTGDGQADVLVGMEVAIAANGSPRGAAMVMTGPVVLGDTTPTPVDLGLLGDAPPVGFSAAAGDFLGDDGVPDLALSHVQFQSISLYQGQGDGSLAHVGTRSLMGLAVATSPPQPTQLQVVDLDGDGQRDLVVANAAAGAGQLFVYYGSGGTLPATPTAISTVLPGGGVGQSFSIAVADLGGTSGPDGRLDVVLSGFNQPELGVLFQTAPRVFQVVRLATGDKPTQIAVGDLNQDDRLDLAVVWPDEDLLAVYYQNPSPTPGDLSSALFGATLFPTPSQPQGLAIADLNGDGANDVAVSSRGTNTIAIFLQR
jgi:FG-GAP-like repeat